MSYGALVSGGTFAGVDQGIDFTGGPFNIFALGNGIVKRVEASGSGWPGMGALVTYQITSGQLAGKMIYVAEDFVPKVSVGDKVTAGQVIGRATGSGQAPGIEIGFADASGHAFGSTTGGPQPQGNMFNQVVQQLSAGVKATDTSFTGTLGRELQDPRAYLHVLTGGLVGGTADQGQTALHGVTTTASGVLGTFSSVAEFLSKVTDRAFAIRVLEMIGGVGLVAVGLALLAKQIGLADAVPAPAPVTQAAKGVS